MTNSRTGRVPPPSVSPAVAESAGQTNCAGRVLPMQIDANRQPRLIVLAKYLKAHGGKQESSLGKRLEAALASADPEPHFSMADRNLLQQHINRDHFIAEALDEIAVTLAIPQASDEAAKSRRRESVLKILQADVEALG